MKSKLTALKAVTVPAVPGKSSNGFDVGVKHGF